MPMCPANHFSVRLDFCDVCGTQMDPREPAPQAAAPAAPAEPCPDCGTMRLGQFCEACGFDFASGQVRSSWLQRSAALVSRPAARGTAVDKGVSGRTPIDGADLRRARPPAGTWDAFGKTSGVSGATTSGAVATTSWMAVASADRGYYDRVVAGGAPDARTIQFPRYCPERRFRLAGREMRIGRRSASRGIEPEIDLTGPPTDPGISHLHAVLLAETGGWALVDPGSANGTLINGIELAAGERVPLRRGDRIYLGAWTVLTILAG
jgi:hypothetical protein